MEQRPTEPVTYLGSPMDAVQTVLRLSNSDLLELRIFKNVLSLTTSLDLDLFPNILVPAGKSESPQRFHDIVITHFERLLEIG